MDKLFKRTRATIILSGILLIVLSIIALVVPIGSATTSVTIVGWTLIVAGGITIATSFARSIELYQAQADLVLAGLEVVPGIIMVMDPTLFVPWLWSVLGLYVVLTGVEDTFEAYDLRGLANHHWTWRLAIAIFTIVTGLIVFGATFYSTVLGMLLAALALLLDGITELISGIRLTDPDKGTEYDE